MMRRRERDRKRKERLRKVDELKKFGSDKMEERLSNDVWLRVEKDEGIQVGEKRRRTRRRRR